MIQDLSPQAYTELQATAQTPVLIDFWAPWCAPCRSLAPIIESLATVFGDKLVIAKLNIDEATDIAADLNLTSIPCCILFKAGKEVDRIIGLKSQADLVAFCNNNL